MNNIDRSILVTSNSLAIICLIFCLFHTYPVACQSALPLPYTLSSEQMLKYTQLYTGERLPDNRPYVSGQLLERFKTVTIEEAWAVLRDSGYTNQFQGKWEVTHENPVLVGRAVTCNFIPHRPDIADVVAAEGQEMGLEGRDKHWIMDQLQEGDVLVVDLLDKQIGGAFIGDNLANMISEKTGTGVIIWGGARDLAGILELKEFTVFNRNWDPSNSITYDKTMVIGYNTPIVIGRAAVIPGDVVLGLREGVIFVPAHLALLVVETSEWTRLKDEFGHARLREGIYSGGEIDSSWTDAIIQDFRSWLRIKINDLPVEQQEMIKREDWY